MGDLKRLFEPASIAVVGASANPEKLGHSLMRNIVDAGTSCRIYPISRSGEEILGYPTYRSLRDLPESPDLALISLAGQHVTAVVAEAAEIHTGAAVILSAGFGETRHQSGKDLEQELSAIAAASGMRILGPNCLGVYNAGVNLNGTYLVKAPIRKGNISLASQSGAYCGILVNELNSRGLGLSKFASTGNQVDIRHQEIIEYFGDDVNTEVIGLFVEGIKDGPRFVAAVRKVGKVKPIVVFQVGRTAVGRRAAASHTGSMVGDFDVAQAALRQAGAILAHSTDEFHDYLCAFSCNSHRLPADNSVAIVTISGGPSVAASDCCEEIGLSVPRLGDDARSELAKYLPSFASDSNPVDMTVATRPENFGPAVDVIMAQSNISGAIAVNWGFDSIEFAQAFADAGKKHGKPVLAYAVENPRVQEVFRQNGIPVLPSPERAVRSYWGLVRYAAVRRKQEEP